MCMELYIEVLLYRYRGVWRDIQAAGIIKEDLCEEVFFLVICLALALSKLFPNVNIRTFIGVSYRGIM